MTQQIVVGFPPNYRELRDYFGAHNVRGAIFSWGDKIFNPYRIKVSPALVAHEAVHGERQQRTGVEHWWERYLADKDFRLNEEILGHQAEFRSFCSTDNTPSRRAKAALAMADRLSGPLYGYAISFGDAKHRIIDGLSLES